MRNNFIKYIENNSSAPNSVKNYTSGLNAISKIIGRDLFNITSSQEISNIIDGEKLFLQIYSINPKFRLKYLNKKIIIELNILNKRNEYVKDLLDLLLFVKSCIKSD